MTAAIVINIVFAAMVLTAIVGMILWGVRTQTRDGIDGVAERRRAMDRRRVARPVPIAAGCSAARGSWLPPSCRENSRLSMPALAVL